jgi:lipopolysaccharide/colanic/teichoic acid biosynthesis glycosyltransferase
MEAVQAPSRFGYLAVKRCLDVLLASIALLALSPLFLIIAVAIKLDSHGPVIYVQKRVRGNQNPQDPHPERNVFNFYKFRSMYVNSDARIHQQYMREYIRGNNGKINKVKSRNSCKKDGMSQAALLA